MSFRLILLLCFFGLFVACDYPPATDGTETGEMEDPEGELRDEVNIGRLDGATGGVLGTYSGELPCPDPDCEGISYQLTVKEDETWEEIQTYRGSDGRVVRETGSWSVREDDGILELERPRKINSNTEYLIVDDQLYLVNNQGEVIPESDAGRYKLVKNQ